MVCIYFAVIALFVPAYYFAKRKRKRETSTMVMLCCAFLAVAVCGYFYFTILNYTVGDFERISATVSQLGTTYIVTERDNSGVETVCTDGEKLYLVDSRKCVWWITSPAVTVMNDESIVGYIGRDGVVHGKCETHGVFDECNGLGI